jgi:hypothetical protein
MNVEVDVLTAGTIRSVEGFDCEPVAAIWFLVSHEPNFLIVFDHIS